MQITVPRTLLAVMRRFEGPKPRTTAKSVAKHRTTERSVGRKPRTTAKSVSAITQTSHNRKKAFALRAPVFVSPNCGGVVETRQRFLVSRAAIAENGALGSIGPKQGLQPNALLC